MAELKSEQVPPMGALSAALAGGKVVEEPELEQLIPIGSTGKRVLPKYACDPGYSPSSDCFSVRFSPDEQFLACSFKNGAINVYNAVTGEQDIPVLFHAIGPKSADVPITQVRWRPMTGIFRSEPALLSVCYEGEGKVLHWDINSCKVTNIITEAGNQPFCVDYNSEATSFATAGTDRIVRLYDEREKKLLQAMQGGDNKETVGHSNRIMAMKFHPTEPSLLITGGMDNTTQIWDTRVGYSVRSLWNCDITGDSIDWAQDGRHILTGSRRHRNALQIWDSSTGECIENVDWGSVSPKGETCMIFGAQFSKDPTSIMIVAGGSNANETKFFTRTGDGHAVPFGALVHVPRAVYCVDWSPKTSMCAIGGQDGKVRVVQCA